jgi:3-phosphoshikimate 1-carboxyvinyltransferase
MTLNLCRLFGMQINENRTSEGRTEFVIPAKQSCRLSEYFCEPDLSSAFVVAALAAVAGTARIQNFPRTSLQPDAVFVSVLRDIGVPLRLENNELIVEKANSLKGVHVDLQNSPDLFPVLAALCAVATTPSTVQGISHLRYKESSRLEKSRELLAMVGARIEGNDQSVTIRPTNLKPAAIVNSVFHPAGDHRMVMAAQVLRQMGYPINIEGIGAVRKSFPEFQKFIEGAT